METNRFLPSGEWEGFYCYYGSQEQHKMEINLHFNNSIITGSGMDDIAPFRWQGSYQLDMLKLQMTKIYQTHEIFYRGDIDENGIWGMWENVIDHSQYSFSPKMMSMVLESLKSSLRGGFHIWPKKFNKNTNQEISEVEESKLLKTLSYV